MMRIALSILLALVLAVPAAAAPGSAGSGGSPVNTGQEPPKLRLQRDTDGSTLTPQRSLPPAVQLQGTVRTAAGAPMKDIVVKVFSNGVTVASGRTGTDGSFSIEANPMTDESTTTGLWFQSPDPERWVDTNVLLSVSKAAQERKLIPGCTQRIPVGGGVTVVDVTMMSVDERKDALEASKCLEVH